jgi:hypothetical protein
MQDEMRRQVRRRQARKMVEQMRKGRIAKAKALRAAQAKPEPKPKVQRQPFRDLPAETLDRMEAILYRISKRKMRIA